MLSSRTHLTLYSGAVCARVVLLFRAVGVRGWFVLLVVCCWCVVLVRVVGVCCWFGRN
jgi:hypothetical protein